MAFRKEGLESSQGGQEAVDAPDVEDAKKGPSFGKGIAASVERLRGNSPFLAARLDEGKFIGHEGVEILDLPRYKDARVSGEVFLSNPEEVLGRVGSERFFVYLQPPPGKGIPRRKTDTASEEVIDFVRANIPVAEAADWKVLVTENYPNAFGGNIVVNKDGSIQGDFDIGKAQGPIASGEITPRFRVRKKLSGSFKYEFDESASKEALEEYGLDDTGLRKLFYSALRHIPHDGDEFLPGYYEVHIVKKKPDGPMETLFVDYRDNPVYQTDWKPPRGIESPEGLDGD